MPDIEYRVIRRRGEQDVRSLHPLISHTPVPSASPHEAQALDPWASRPRIIESLATMCASMTDALAQL